MTLATTYGAALALAILSMLCLGSWANGLKLAGRWRFEFFCFDFSFGLLLTSLVLAFTAGTLGYDSFTFMDDLLRAAKRSLAYGLGGGIVFCLGNMLLLGSMSLMGMTLAFLTAYAMAIAVTSLLSHAASPSGSPALVFTGVALFLLAIIASGVAHRSLSLLRELEKMKAGEHRTLKPAVSWRGFLLSLGSGALLGLFTPIVDLSRSGDVGIGPYSLGVMFSIGIVGATFVFNLYFMNLPVKGEPVELLAYFQGRPRQHLLGVLSGSVWALGMIGAFVLASSPPEAFPDHGLRAALANSPALLAALWGLFAWNETRGADAKASALITLVFFLFAAGVVMLSVAASQVSL